MQLRASRLSMVMVASRSARARNRSMRFHTVRALLLPRMTEVDQPVLSMPV